MDAQYYRFQLGDFECVALCDGSMDYTLESFVTNAPKEQVEAVLKAANLPVDHITTPYTYLYVNTGKQRVLVDMGAGKHLPSTGRLLQSMQMAGIRPGEIDDVFITHAHPDHIGGALDEAGHLVFANAHYFIWKSEWDFWFSEAALEKPGGLFTQFARTSLLPMSGQVTCVESEDELLPGVRMLAAPGHTPGHAVVTFTSGGRQLFYTGDTVLYPFHLEHTEWLPVFDILPELADPSKRRIFDMLAETNSLMVGQHFPPFPSLGTIHKQGDGWSWEPVEAVENVRF
ncbi:MAG: MBL fold metallo-hydrolase [Omnitrophica WOR_2 bacterium]